MRRKSEDPQIFPIKAAQYVRMSTEHQQYSIDNQSDAIRRYAQDHQMEIVRTYTDPGKTGLTIDRRPALRQLLKDVEGPSPGYSVVLVYDVSRWGRFQDMDESAYYEHRCRRAKIAVHYCVESFPNDGSIMSAILKTLKRAMAAEYSRELSVKVFAGKCRLTELGFRQGGTAGYGYRRLLIDQHGNRRFLLQDGERKSIATDRIILIPGPPKEREIVREIFRLYISRLSPAKIAKRLNDRGVPWMNGRPWTRHIIKQMVTNPKYIGANVTNRFSGKLMTPRKTNPREMWVRCDNAFEALVDFEMFRKAEAMAADRATVFTDEQLLDYLKQFLNERGMLSQRQISAELEMPCREVYSNRFGSLLEAYRRIGYVPPRDYSYIERDRKLLSIRRAFSSAVIAELSAHGFSPRRVHFSKLLVVNETFTVRAIVARCRFLLDQSPRWLFRLHSTRDPDFTIVARLDTTNEKIVDYYCFPRSARLLRDRMVAPMNSNRLEKYHFEDFSFVIQFIINGRQRPNRPDLYP